MVEERSRMPSLNSEKHLRKTNDLISRNSLYVIKIVWPLKLKTKYMLFLDWQTRYHNNRSRSIMTPRPKILIKRSPYRVLFIIKIYQFSALYKLSPS